MSRSWADARLLAPATPPGEPPTEEPESEEPDADADDDETVDADADAEEDPDGDGEEGDGASKVPGPRGAGPGVVPRMPTLNPGNAIAEPEGEAEAEGVAAINRPPPTDPTKPLNLNTELEAPKLEKPKLLRKRNVPPFWVDMEYSTHRTRALSFPPIFVHRTPKPQAPEKFMHFDLSLSFGFYAKRRQRKVVVAPLIAFGGSFSKRASGWFAAPLLMGYKRTGESYNFGQFPLVWAWGNKHVKNLLVVPFHYHKKTPESFMGVSSLLFWYGHTDVNDADPENDRRHFVGAPLFWRFQRGQKRVDVFAPVYVGGFNKLKGLKHHSFFPLFHWQSNEFGNRRELWTLPFVLRRDRARGRSAWAIPPLLTFREKTRHGSLTSVTPLVWHSTNAVKGSATTVAGPFVLHRDPQQRNSVFFPLWWQFKDRQRQVTSTLFFPLAGARKTPTETHFYTLLGGGTKAKDGWGFAAPPLLTFVRHRREGKRHQVVTPLFWHFHDTKAFDGKGSDTVVVPPLFYRNRRADDTRLGLPALFTFTRKTPERSYQVVTPMFWRFRNRDPAVDGQTIVIPPVYAQRKKTGWQAGVAPLLFMRRDDEVRHTILPLFLTGDYADVKEKTRLTISPLFVQSRAPGRRTIGAGFLAWDSKRDDGRDSVFFPLYYRRARPLAEGG
ncbi:MAG: hypothetical protein KC636_36880, partial [Myxococcales bacterium]|nr:hypothetical protein [Myxococcales bacterium]